MTREEYLKSLDSLGLAPCSQATASALCISVRQCVRLASGVAEVPDWLAKLVSMYVRYGRVPRDLR